MKKVLIGGASGLIGTALATHLESQGYEVTRLKRGVHWNPETNFIEPQLVEECDAIINLAGAGIGDKR